jgi:ADP-heptose:LPS heptosyltransferase
VPVSGARGRKVGLVWTGDPQNLGNRERSVSMQQLGLLARCGEITFFSLQKGGDAAKPGAVPDGMHFVDLTHEIRDFSDTIALSSQLDLLVSIDTSVAHLAGAMGIPTWVLLPFSADWRYHVQRRDNPWYPTMRLFRQPADGDWQQALHQLATELSEWRHRS